MQKSGGPSCEPGVHGRLENSVPKTEPFVKKHNLFYNFTNITIKMVKFYPNSISCILNLLWSIDRPFQLYIFGYTMSVLGGSVLGTFP